MKRKPIVLPYFPFTSDVFHTQMGVQPLGERPLIEIDPAHYHAEQAQKHALLAADEAYYAQALPGSEAAQWEALALVLRNLANHYPQHFLLNTTGDLWQWQNHLLKREYTFRFGDLEALSMPIDWVGRQVQEDLLLLGGEEPFPLIAGQLCFPNVWSLKEKIGQPFLEIHAPVPHFATTLGRSSSLLMVRLKPERPVWRLNWSIKTNNWLDLSTRHSEADQQSRQGITPENAGESCWLRVERQGLARLAISGAVLFTIHTYLSPIADLASNPVHAKRLLGVLRTAPADLLVYKGIASFAAPLCAYLEQKITSEGR